MINMTYCRSESNRNHKIQSCNEQYCVKILFKKQYSLSRLVRQPAQVELDGKHSSDSNLISKL
jgi:hypothetical protein